MGRKMCVEPSAEYASREASVEHQQLKKGGVIVKKTIIAFACALVAPLAFAQTSTTTTETTTSTHGTVTTYEPGKRIVVRTERESNPISYVLGKTAHYVNKAGRKIDEHLIRPGSRVIVYTSRGQMHAAKRVVLDED
ncbi:MAG: hypothetical protein DMF34_02150 [Verrucomicrobia bacterium]|nr:MAG: hypothetical protein DMF34_02150 [Verrucomicrobiota bacterium]